MWPRSAWPTETWARLRRTMAEKVSMMGMPASTKGSSRVVMPATRVTESSDMQPRLKPSKSYPESPMKMQAGEKL